LAETSLALRRQEILDLAACDRRQRQYPERREDVVLEHPVIALDRAGLHGGRDAREPAVGVVVERDRHLLLDRRSQSLCAESVERVLSLLAARVALLTDLLAIDRHSEAPRFAVAPLAAARLRGPAVLLAGDPATLPNFASCDLDHGLAPSLSANSDYRDRK